MYIHCIYMHIQCIDMYIRCTWVVYVHTLYRRVHTLYRHVHTLYMSTTHFMTVPPRCACTAFLIVINNAMVQEFAHLYIHCHAVYKPPKNGSGRWSAFLWHFHIFVYIHQYTLFNHVQTMFKRWRTRMYTFFSKCYRKADHLPEPFLGGLYTAWQCMYRWANSCTIALSIPITKCVQASTNGIHEGNASDRERKCM